MSKPILIDALHITMGGGKGLLEYLVNSLIEKSISFHLLRDERCPILKNEENISRVTVMLDSGHNRKQYYIDNYNVYISVLCFANLPAPIKMPCPVYTYMHNVNLLKIPKNFSFTNKIKNWLKQRYIAYYAKNTDAWIVQTQNTEDCLRKVLPCSGKRIFQLPFYKIQDSLKEIGKDKNNRMDYILVGDYTGTRGHDELVTAWIKLAEHGFNSTLHLTISENHPFCLTLKSAIKSGANIINHGIVPFEELSRLYRMCKATVYPSINESLGLGVIEAIWAGCDVIGIDLPFIHCICIPSITFPNQNVDAIVKAVLCYENGYVEKSKLIVKDHIEDLIELLANY